MCNVCDLNNENWKLKCGDRPLEGAYLYCVYVGTTARLNLCRLHSIELFSIGEIRFLQKHIKLAIDLNQNKRQYSSGHGQGY